MNFVMVDDGLFSGCVPRALAFTCPRWTYGELRGLLDGLVARIDTPSAWVRRSDFAPAEWENLQQAAREVASGEAVGYPVELLHLVASSQGMSPRREPMLKYRRLVDLAIDDGLVVARLQGVKHVAAIRNDALIDSFDWRCEPTRILEVWE